MGPHVLVPYDGTARAERGVDHATERYPDATVTLLSVVEPLSEAGCERSDAPLDADGPLRADGGPSAAEAFVEACDGDRGPDLRAATEPGVPAATIVEYAADHDVDAVVMGTGDRSRLRRLLFGSVSETVDDAAPVPVTLVD